MREFIGGSWFYSHKRAVERRTPSSAEWSGTCSPASLDVDVRGSTVEI
jgi:hypothetical protein